MEGDDHGEDTQQCMGGLSSRESSNIAEAEAFSAEGNMCGAGRQAPTSATPKPHHVRRDRTGTWEIHGSPDVLVLSGPRREGQEPKPTMSGREKSTSADTVNKPTNKTGHPVVEPVERRVRTKGNADQQAHSGRRAGSVRPRRWTAYGKPQGKGRATHFLMKTLPKVAT